MWLVRPYLELELLEHLLVLANPLTGYVGPALHVSMALWRPWSWPQALFAILER